jgi:hypothetical protein
MAGSDVGIGMGTGAGTGVSAGVGAETEVGAVAGAGTGASTGGESHLHEGRWQKEGEGSMGRQTQWEASGRSRHKQTGPRKRDCGGEVTEGLVCCII